MNINDSDSAAALGPLPDKNTAVPKTTALKARLAKILATSGIKSAEADSQNSEFFTHFTFGVEALDQALRGNAIADGLPRAALHEIHAAGKGDTSSAAAMALLLAERSQKNTAERSILWVSESGEARRQGRLYPPGLAELGMDPASIIYVDAPDSISVLRAAADGVRSSALGAVIVELAGKKPKGLDMTATRRLSLSAQKSGVLCLLLRSGNSEQDPLPTAAFSRWAVDSAPSIPLEANAPGHPAFNLTLLRHRSGLYGLKTQLEWNREYRIFRQISGEQPKGITTPNIGAIPPLVAIRTDHKDAQAA